MQDTGADIAKLATTVAELESCSQYQVDVSALEDTFRCKITQLEQGRELSFKYKEELEFGSAEETDEAKIDTG